jgi:hypothetical protein
MKYQHVFYKLRIGSLFSLNLQKLFRFLLCKKGHIWIRTEGIRIRIWIRPDQETWRSDKEVPDRHQNEMGRVYTDPVTLDI